MNPSRWNGLLLPPLIVALAACTSTPATQGKEPGADSFAAPPVSIAEEADAVMKQDVAEEAEFRTPNGYKKKKRGDTVVYCRSETPIGTRFAEEYCFTQNQLQRVEKSKQGMQDDVAMRQRMCTTQTACGEY